MLIARNPVRGRSVVGTLTFCSALTLSAGLAVAQPPKAKNPSKVSSVDTAKTAQFGTAPAGFERRRLPSREESIELFITGLDSPVATGISPIDTVETPRTRFLKSTPAQTRLESKLIVEAADRATLVKCLIDAGIPQGKGWLNRNVKPLAQSTTMFAVNLPTVRVALNSAEKLLKDSRIDFAEISVGIASSNLVLPTDPFVPLQYFFDNTLDINGNRRDHGLSAAYDLGFTGQGVTVGVIEAGDFSYQAFGDAPGLSHEDLFANHRQDYSQDYNPFTLPTDYSHANAVAGIIAATANNGLGGAGIAYNANLAGLNNGPAIGSSLQRAQANLWRNDVIDIKNNSWGFFYTVSGGPSYSIISNGAFESVTTDRASYRISAPGRALRGAATDSGTIFVMASGNNGLWSKDHVPFSTNFIEIDPDGVVASIGASDLSTTYPNTWTGVGERTEYSSTAKWREVLAIAAVGEDNKIAGYSTTGTNVIASAYSQGFNNKVAINQDSLSAGGGGQRGIFTTDIFDGTTNFYNTSFSGTSAAAPMASGIIALMLEANPSLSLRDIKHILKETSDWTRIPDAFANLSQGRYISTDSVINAWYPFDASSIPLPHTMWQVNAGFQVHSDEYGFGIIDAEAAVSSATHFAGAPPLVILDTGPITVTDGELPSPGYIDIADREQSVDVIVSISPSPICVRPNILIEEVELSITVTGAGAGDLLIGIRSGGGSFSTFAFPRVDGTTVSVGGVDYAYYKYKFNSLKHWGELSGGEWTLTIADMAPDTFPTIVGDVDLGNAFARFPPGTSMGIDGVTTQKALTEYQLRIYGTRTGEDPYMLCNIGNLNCPGDIDGDGIVTPKDLMAFIDLYLAGSFLADFDLDGDVDFADLLAFYRSWSPGPCGGGGGNFPDGNRRQAPDVITIG